MLPFRCELSYLNPPTSLIKNCRFTGDAISPVPNPMGYTNHSFDISHVVNMKSMGPVKRKMDDAVEM